MFVDCGVDDRIIVRGVFFGAGGFIGVLTTGSLCMLGLISVIAAAIPCVCMLCPGSAWLA